MHLRLTAVLLGSSPLALSAPSELHQFESRFVSIRPDGGARPDIAGCTVPSGPWEISAYEVTNTEYAAFLNSVASDADPLGLYSPLHEQHFWGGIVRTKSGAGSSYAVKLGYEDLPATFVSWHDAARYANWLHFGRPVTGRSEPGTTEGTEALGAYDTRGFAAGRSSARNAQARYFIPTCGEWLYAGFFDPATRSLTRYVGGNSLPPAGAPGTSTRTANYYATGWALAFPHLAPVTEYAGNKSALGTFNQAGNVMEWVETDGRMVLGGSLFLPADTLSLDYRDLEHPAKKLSSFGFRLARRSGVDATQPLSFSAPVAPVATRETTSAPAAEAPGSAQWTRIDTPGNLSDIKTGRGCVPYVYEISRTEITNAQYAAFLNAVASVDDRHRLYVEDMGTGVVGGLLRTGPRGHHGYAAKPGFANRPATYLSWFSLARYANWLHYGMPSGPQTIGVTEGDSSQGAYDTSGFADYARGGADKKPTHATFSRNPGAKYFIPNDDEWYKAAYFDPEKRGWRKYWNFPARTDVAPPNEPSAGANFQRETLGEGPPFYVSEAGTFSATGHYGVQDLGGNVWEWLEGWRGLGDGTCWRCDIPTKGLRGGSFNYIAAGLRNGNVDPGAPTDHYFVYGGRLARRDATGPAATSWCASPRLRHRAIPLLNGAWAGGYAAAAAALFGGIVVGTVVWRWRRRRG